jgi:hypothetical protein
VSPSWPLGRADQGLTDPLWCLVCRASLGTTKYCNAFLRYIPCNSPDCLFLHEVGSEDDSLTKEDIQVRDPTLRHPLPLVGLVGHLI